MLIILYGDLYIIKGFRGPYLSREMRRMRSFLIILIVVTTLCFAGSFVTERENEGVKFTLSIFPVHAGQVLFADDFEKQELGDWRSGIGIVPYWEIKEIEGNSVLSGKGLGSENAFIDVGGDDWTDYSFRIKVKRIAGTFSIGFRLSQKGRYYIGFDENKGSLYLRKNKPWGKNFDLAEKNVQIDQNKWYILNILVQGSNIKVLIDEDLKIDYTDVDPLLYGCISAISLNGSEIHFDDVRIESLVH